MNKMKFLPFFVVLATSACSSQQNACEDASEAAAQVQECKSLHQQIIQAKDRPLIRTELERRYQDDCIDVRYYRDDHTDAVCGNKEKVSEIEQKLEIEKDQ